MKDEELKASGLLLDLGVSIPVRPLRYLQSGKRRHSITMRYPGYGALLRIARMYLGIGVTYEELRAFTPEQNMEFLMQHGKEVSRLVAYAILPGWITGRVFNKPLAWWLRWRVHPLFMAEAMFQLLTMIDHNPFQTIIKSAEALNLLKPKLSPEATRS